MTRTEIENLKPIVAAAKTAKIYTVSANNRSDVQRATIESFVREAKSNISSKSDVHLIILV